MKLVSIILGVFLLTGCATVPQVVQTAPIERSKLDLQDQKPLVMRSVVWKVVKIDNTTYVALTPTMYSNLSKNMEDVQNRLNIERVTTQKYKQYYEQNQ